MAGKIDAVAPKNSHAGWSVRKYASAAEAERHESEFWAQIPAEQQASSNSTPSIAVRMSTRMDAACSEPVVGLPVNVIGRADLIRNKRASGRTQDQANLERLGQD